ncbi:MAG: hypothetical protein UW39_C0005G0034 [Parcubacteria group bacterium GW2011_GWC2_44_17]|nr:MAG: hypothetical protein UW39_C0005G0034 [Parcubacteria group bacterium GW2011_GWC2_44_17]KKT49303.1 MAG: hypothetical protein UW40_C0023G0023 [Parcubacteria group bacterium GW2011_GWF2_44_17]
MSRVTHKNSKFSSVRAALIVLALALFIFTLAPGVVWGQTMPCLKENCIV